MFSKAKYMFFASITTGLGNDVAAGDEPNEYLYGVGFNSDQGVLDVGNTRDKRYH